MKQVSFRHLEHPGHGLVLTLALVLTASSVAPAQAGGDPEHEVTWQAKTAFADLEGAWRSRSPSQGFEAYYTASGIRVVPRADRGRGWNWALSLSGYGRGGTVVPTGPARLSPTGNRIELDREDILEWYLNDSRGLEHGFTLTRPPQELPRWTADRRSASRAGSEALAPAFLELVVGGTLHPVIGDDARSIDFAARKGIAELHYSELTVFDALERELPAWFEMPAGSGASVIRIVYDDGDAIYPVTVDPLLTTPAWSVGGSGDFGVSVSTAGDVNGDGYDDVIVGARRFANGQADEGAAFVYHGSPSGVETTASWTAEGNQTDAEFGYSVSGAGDVNGDGYDDVIVGAWSFSAGQSGEGRAFVFHGSTSGLSTTADWTAEADQAGASFGRSVSGAGDVNGDGYDDVIVGAYLYDDTESAEGRVFVYHGSPTGLHTSADWTADGGQGWAFFGLRVSSAGDVNGDGYGDVIIGAEGYDNEQYDEGRAFVYVGSPTGLGATPDWTAESNQDDALFGGSVSGAGDVNGDGYDDVIVGDYYYDGPEFDEGWAFVYLGGASGLANTAGWTMDSDQAGALFGAAVSAAGDVDNDGYDDVVIGAYQFDNPDSNEGAAFLYHGGPTGLDTVPGWTAEGDQAGAAFGHAVSTAGDVNGDGNADVIVGAVFYPTGGRAFVYHGTGGPSCIPPDQAVSIQTLLLTDDGNDDPVLHFSDPNSGDRVTGYNIYRSSDPALPHETWPLLAHGVVDEDPIEPDIQWVDTSGDPSPSECWFYQVAAYNSHCPDETAEGPW